MHDFLDLPDPNLVGITLSDTLTEDDYEAFTSALEDQFAAHITTRVLLVMEDVDDWAPEELPGPTCSGPFSPRPPPTCTTSPGRWARALGRCRTPCGALPDTTSCTHRGATCAAQARAISGFAPIRRPPPGGPRPSK